MSSEEPEVGKSTESHSESAEPTSSTGAPAAVLEDENVLPRSVHLHPAVHIRDEDSDHRISAKLRSQGVRIGEGLIAPAVF